MVTDETRRGDGGASTDESRWTEVASRRHEPGTEGDLAFDIVFSIAEAADVDPTEVRDPKLHDILDVGAVKAMFFSPAGKSTDAESGAVEFPYNEYLVRVQRNGWIRVFAPSMADH